MNYKKELAQKAPGFSRGFFITLEGLDGAGKSTQGQKLAAALRELGFDPLMTKEPTDGPFGREIRELAQKGRKGITPQEELELFVRDRAEDVERFAPALLGGRPVIADRYILSNVAYQSSLGLAEKHILKQNAPFPWPDLIVILELSVADALARLKSSRPGQLEETYENASFLTKVKARFDAQTDSRIIRLDANAAPEQITADILAALRQRNLLVEKPLTIIDSHCHLSSRAYKEDLPLVLERARAIGVTDVLNIGLGLENASEVLAQHETHPHLRPVVGWHPHEADEYAADEYVVTGPQTLSKLVKLAQNSQVRGWGEFGLDYALMHSSKENQLKLFEAMLEAATDLALPLVIHSRDAFQDTYALLRKYMPKCPKGGVIHCFTRDWAEAEAYLDLGLHLSLPGVVTYPQAHELREAARKIPADRLLVETDAPYLTPVPYRGQRNEPSYLVWTLLALAELRGELLADLAAQTAANTRRLFELL